MDRNKRFLTPKQQLIMELIAEGLDTKQIAEETNTSVSNIEKMITRILDKVDAHNRTNAVTQCFRRGIIGF